MAKLARLFEYVRPYMPTFGVLAAFSVASSLTATLQPWPLKMLMDQVLGDRPATGLLADILTLVHASSTGGILLFVVGASLLIYLLNSSIDVLSSWVWTVVGRTMAYDLAQRMFAKLQRRSLAYHASAGVGDAMVRISGDSWSVYTVFTSAVYGPAHSVFAIVLMAVVMVQLDPALTALTFASTPIVLGASFLLGRKFKGVAEAERRLDAQIRSHVQQVLVGISVVQAHNREAGEEQRFRGYAQDSLQIQRRNIFISAQSGFYTGLANTLGGALLLWAAAERGLVGKISVGDLLVFLAYSRQLQTNVVKLAGVRPALRKLEPALERLSEILHTEPEVTDAADAVTLGRARGEVRFENVGFAYEPGRPVLRDISFAAQPGETVALVGPTGAGKSTLVSLIPRFFDAAEGRVLLDGRDLRRIKLSSLRDQVALVLQEPFLFPMSIADNIAYGRPHAARSEIEAAARAANAHDFIGRLPQGYDTVIGERGATLSGGERQRLSIARALLKDAPILILDEPTSALDAGTEAMILEALETLVKGRTTFIIAHRLATVQHADRILVLNNGAIEETGTHAELVRKGGLYANYAVKQFLAPAETHPA